MLLFINVGYLIILCVIQSIYQIWPIMFFFSFFKKFYWDVVYLNNVIFISGVGQSESVTPIRISTLL